jgi:hypothetical protein
MALCGEPTKAGTPCKNQSYSSLSGVDWVMPCSTHSRPGHYKFRALLQQAFDVGSARGASNERSTARLAAENEKRKDAMIAAYAENSRTHDASGRQLVRVKNYTYHWGDLTSPLNVGDEVMLPGSYWNPSPWSGTIVALGSDYKGATVSVIKVVSRASQLVN